MVDHGLPSRFFNPSAFVFDAEVAIALIADMHIRKGMERGEFDDLPGAGKPLDIPDRHDPDWWIKALVKREGLVLLPPSIQLRKDDAALDEKLDQLPHEAAVRKELEQFNERVIWARYQLPEGPPLITQPRDVETSVTAWAGRRTARIEEARRKAEAHAREQERERAGATTRGRTRRWPFRPHAGRRQPPTPGADQRP